MVDYSYCFMHVKLSLHLWNEANLILVDKFLVCLFLFIENRFFFPHIIDPDYTLPPLLLPTSPSIQIHFHSISH